MDEQVLAGQRWVNQQYSAVDGFQPCPENGATSWATMHSLTMGLQVELGISPISAAFGPTTYERFAKLGEILPDTRVGKNIIHLLQCGLWAKGFWACDPGREGEYGITTINAVRRMRDLMGLSDGGINADIARAILNMDAYQLLPGGKEAVRDIQRWLNGRYWQTDAYSLCPCDGIYSRDVQRALMIGIQCELGVTAPTGTFGPQTQALLRQHPLRSGDSSTLAHLGIAACVVNSPTYTADQVPVTISWHTIVDDTVLQWTRVFQESNAIPVTGEIDFTTWAQLLISCGDISRAVSAADTRFSITESRAAWLKTNGYRAIGRYIYEPADAPVHLDKEIKPGELELMFSHGLSLIPIFQTYGRDVSDFNYLSGCSHGATAVASATYHRLPSDAIIYFAVDFDATEDQIETYVVPYFNGVCETLGQRAPHYRVGVYGSRNVCSRASVNPAVCASYVAGMSWGFSGNLGFPIPKNWFFNQIAELSGVRADSETDSWDLDRVAMSSSASCVNTLGPSPQEIQPLIATIRSIVAAALEYSQANSKPTGPSDITRLSLDFCRHVAYSDLEWRKTVGEIDGNFVEYCSRRGIVAPSTMIDPVSNRTLHVDHILATAEGHWRLSHSPHSKAVDSGDIPGWGGDLITFWRDWKANTQNYRNCKEYSGIFLGATDRVSSFDFRNLAEDADGYLLAQLLGSGSDLVSAIETYYVKGECRSRFTHYLSTRWGDAAICTQAALDLLTSPAVDAVILAARTVTWFGIQPAALDPASAADMAQTLSSRISQYAQSEPH